MYILVIFICARLFPADLETETAGEYPDNFETHPAGEDDYIFSHSPVKNQHVLYY